MKFSEIPYQRPDMEQEKLRLVDLTAKLQTAKTYEEARGIFLQQEQDAKHLDTMVTLSHIRHTIDTRDKFYDDETAYWNTALPEFQEYCQAWTKAMLESPFRIDFEREYGTLWSLKAETALKTFSPEIIPELQKENELTQAYGKLIASAKISFEGKEYTTTQMGLFKNDADDTRRLAAWKADGQWYKDQRAELDDIYDQLIHLRDTMGKKLGYTDYTTLGYYRMERNCYTKEDVEKFRAAVVKYLVPVADSIYRKTAERLGKSFPLSHADSALWFRSGNPKPQGTAEDILAHGKKFYDELSPETSEFFNTMVDMELMDLLSKKGKAGGGYCTGLAEYEVPFIFANFNGTQGDVTVITHEAGHAFEVWMNRKRIPADYIWPSKEACEVHSMSMEFIAWPWAEGFFGPDTRKFYYTHLAEALTFIPYGTLVDHFQHVVYEKPDMTPEKRHDIWRELSAIYMPWMRLDGEIPFYGESMAWQRQKHIYESPFYYIDYCLAQTVALEVWSIMQNDPKTAWEKYMAYTRQGGSKVFTELLADAGLGSPFDEETLRGVCETASQWLENFDLTGIV